LKEIGEWKWLERKNQKLKEMRKEIYQKKLLLVRRNLLVEMQCLIKDCLIKHQVLTQDLDMMMIIISMTNPYLLIELQHLFIRELKKCQLMMMKKKVNKEEKQMSRRSSVSSHLVDLRVLIIQKVPDPSLLSLKRGS